MVDGHKREGNEQVGETSGNHTDSLSPLTAVSSVDGRYAEKTKPLREYFSEFALIRGRIEIEVEYLIALAQQKVIRPLTDSEIIQLRTIYAAFTPQDAEQIKAIEKTTRHDVKSMEYFLKDKLKNTSLEDILSMVHFAVTSEDITNLAQNLALQRAKNAILVTSLSGLVDALTTKAEEWRMIPILGRTHGREAAATTLGKEAALYAHRLSKKLFKLSRTQFTGKLTGVVGNFHDHKAALPETDWQKFSHDFVRGLGLEPQPFTTQIEPHDRWAEFLHLVGEIMDIVETTDENMWAYLSHDYLFLKPRKGQVGSSVMPHKGRNPIDLENSEGNAIMASGIAKKWLRNYHSHVSNVISLTLPSLEILVPF